MGEQAKEEEETQETKVTLDDLIALDELFRQFENTYSLDQLNRWEEITGFSFYEEPTDGKEEKR